MTQLLPVRSLTVVICAAILLGVCHASWAYGQRSKVDSLRQRVAQAPDPETKVQRLLDLHQELCQAEQYDSTCLIPLEEAIRLARQEHLTEKLIDAYLKKAFYYRNVPENDSDSTYHYLRKSLGIAQQQGHRQYLPEILMHLGTFYFSRREQMDSALHYYTLSLEVNEPTINSWLKASTLQGLSDLYNHTGDQHMALEYALRAIEAEEDYLGGWNSAAISLDNLGRHAEAVEYYLKILEKSKGRFWELIALANLGRSYFLQKEYEKTLPYFYKVIEIYRKNPNLAILEPLGRLGMALSELGRYEEAIAYYREAIDFARQYNHTRDLHMPTSGLGVTYARIGEVDSARKYLNMSLDYATAQHDANYTISNLIELGKLDLSEGLVAQGIARLVPAREEALKAGTKDLILEADKALYEVYKRQGNFEQALRYHEEFKAYSDSVFNNENTARITRLETEYEFEKEKQQLEYEKKQEILKMDAQLRRQRTYQIVTALALIIALVFVFIIARYYRLKQRANQALTQLNNEILEQKEQLQELNQVKSRFFTNISHEFRTPLTIIGGMAEKIEQAPEKWLKQGIRMITRNNAQLLNLVNQILDLRKLESGMLKLDLIQGDIIFYLRYVVESFHSLAADKGIKLHFLNNEKELMMDYDQEKILRVVSNLLSNAIKFTPEGGNVYLLVDSEPLEENSTETTDNISRHFAASSILKLKVKDTGMGIPEEKIPYIFNRFYQVDDSTTRTGEGTGIGLALTRELIHLMGGEIEVESEVGKGTTFRIVLPITRTAHLENPDEPIASVKIEKIANPNLESTPIQLESATLNTAVHNQQPSAALAPSTLLIIEDNIDVVVYLQAILADRYQLTIASDGQEGIDKAIEQIPDLIISDVMMPVKDGFEVCAILKQDERTSHIPIVLLTAKADVGSRIAGLKRGADAYLAKPFNEEELFVRLEKLHQLRLQLQARYRSLEGVLQNMPQDIAVQPSHPANLHPEDAFIVKLKTLIEDNLDNGDFGIPELCKAVGMSRSQLHLKIKALTERSTSHFIRSIRLYKAKELLRHSDLNVSEVAFEVGFQDPAYFSRTFTEEFGISPREFVSDDR